MSSAELGAAARPLRATQVKRKYTELLQSNQELQQDKRELLEKYNLKAT
jgi:hypothetical protein